MQRTTPANASISKVAAVGIGVAALGSTVGLGLYFLRSYKASLWTSAPYIRITSRTIHKESALVDGPFGKPPQEGAPAGGLRLSPSCYPWCRKENEVAECNGVKVSDPWKWMEDPNEPEAAAFAEAQTTLSRSLLPECESLPQLKGLMTAMSDYPKSSCPVRAGEEFVYYLRNPGAMKSNDNVLYMRRGIEGEEIMVLDHDMWSMEPDEVTRKVFFSNDGSLMAYTTTKPNSSFERIRILRLPMTGDTPSGTTALQV